MTDRVEISGTSADVAIADLDRSRRVGWARAFDAERRVAALEGDLAVTESTVYGLAAHLAFAILRCPDDVAATLEQELAHANRWLTPSPTSGHGYTTLEAGVYDAPSLLPGIEDPDDRDRLAEIAEGLARRRRGDPDPPAPRPGPSASSTSPYWLAVEPTPLPDDVRAAVRAALADDDPDET